MNSQTELAASRREFIQQMSLSGVASCIPLSFFSCAEDAPDFVGTGLAPYKVWEEMLMAIKTSPDYLKGRMETLIKSGNPEKMLNKAGINAEVVYEETNFNEKEVKNLFFKPFERKFEPVVNQKILDRWQEELQVTPNEEQSAQIDITEQESNDLASHLFTFLPQIQPNRIHKFKFKWDNRRTPCVKLKQEFENTYAHLFDPLVPFGSLKEGDLTKTKLADLPLNIVNKVAITLSVSKGDMEEIEIVKGEWAVQELIGNHIVIKFDSGLNIFQQLTTLIGSLQTLTPLLALQSYSMDKERMAAKCFIGKTISLQGDVIDTGKEEILVNGIPLLIHPDKDLQKKVKKLAVNAIPGKYPFVRFQISPTDEQGEMVDGLSASNFNINLNGKPINTLMQNNKKTPKVILMYDASLSMPSSYYGENMTQFINSLEGQILENYPAAIVQKWDTSSNSYTWLRKASASNGDLIIFATDGDQKDDFKPEWQTTYQSGAPAIILNVKNSSKSPHLTMFETMAKSTNGIVINVEDQEKTKQFFFDYLKKLDIPPYVFTCNVAEKNEENSINVSIEYQRVSAETSFEYSLFPGDTTPLGTELSGVYLSISYDNKTIKKTLAGHDSILHKSRVPDQSDFLDVRGFLLGGALISIEGRGATLANRMADLLQHKLSSREIGEALLKNETRNARAACENGNYFYDDKSASLMQPLQNQVTNHSLTFASGPIMGIIINKVGVGMPFSTVNFDYVETSNFVRLADNPEEAFKINMQKTAQMAILENSMFEKSAISLLKNQSLIKTQNAEDFNWFYEHFKDPVDNFFWRERIFRGSGTFKIFDQAAQTKAFLRINSISGEVYGMLSNDIAGGVERIQRQLDEISKVMDTYLMLLYFMSARSGIPLAIVGGYGKTLVKLYAIASEALEVMDTSGMDEEIKTALAALACDTYKTIVFGLFGKAGAGMAGLEYLIEMITGKTACNL